MQPLSTSMKRLPVLGAPVGPVISTADRFAKDFWLSSRTIGSRARKTSLFVFLLPFRLFQLFFYFARNDRGGR